MKTKLESVEQAMTMAKALEKKGDIAQAARVYQAVLGRFPKNRRAAQSLKKLQGGLTRRMPMSAQDDVSLAEAKKFRALLKTQEFKTALQFAQSLRKKYPRAAVAPNMAGTALIMLGRYKEAIDQLEAAVSLQPNNIDIICNLAGAHSQAGNLNAAYRAYSRALELKPNHGPALSNRARVCLEANRYQESISDAQKALAINPSDDTTEITLAKAYFRFSKLEEALACFDAVLARAPGSYIAVGGRAEALVALGRLPEAVGEYQRSLALRPDQPAVLFALSNLVSYSADDPQLAWMQKHAERDGQNPQDRARLYFALARAHEKLGDTKASFDFLSRGNRARALYDGYDIAHDEKLFSDIKEFFQDGPLPALKSASLKASQPRPIFILGMPRSGTTLTEQILASHSKVHGAGELSAMKLATSKWIDTERGRPDEAGIRDMLKHIRNAYFNAPQIGASALPVFTDKMPMNFRWIGFILAAMPEARIVHVRRDPMATCWSIYQQLFPSKGLGYASDLKNLGQYYNLYRDLMRFWHGLFPGRIYDLDYESLTDNQEDETRNLLEQCQLDWEDACLEFHTTKRTVSTASATQVRQKMYQGSSQAWKKYETELVTLREVLELPAPAP